MTTYPYQTGTAFTDSGLADAGRWQAKIMSPVTDAEDTVTQNTHGVVDGQGRITSLYQSEARTTTQTSSSLYSRGATGLAATMIVTDKEDNPSVDLSIEYYHAPTDSWVSLLGSAAITDAGTTKLTVSPYVETVSNESLKGVVPDTVRIVVTASNSDSLTYSVGLDWTP